jgi:nicotinate-nucleotide adenylyltransferase
MRIGLFGGTFDPPHFGHLILAERCREEAKLDQVWFLPSYRPPHKDLQKITRFETRCDMTALAIAGQHAFRVEPIEKELPPPSYTAETLRELLLRHPHDEFALIVGGDSLRDLPGWYRPQDLLERAKLIAVPRPGTVVWSADQLASAIGVNAAEVRLQIVECPQVDIASRDIRARVNEGKTIRYLLPRSIEEMIRERDLYRNESR